MLPSFIQFLTKDMGKDELEFLYLVYNFLIHVTEKPTSNVYLTKEEAKLVHYGFINAKQGFVKEMSKDTRKKDHLIRTIHINPTLRWQENERTK